MPKKDVKKVVYVNNRPFQSTEELKPHTCIGCAGFGKSQEAIAICRQMLSCDGIIWLEVASKK